MKQKITDHKTFSLATVTVPKTKLAICHVTADIHENKTLETQTLQLLYTEALLSGCGKYSREQFLDTINSLGASVSVNISSGALSITLKSTAEQYPKLLKIAETMLKNPTFSKKELDRIKKVTINQLNEAKEDSRSVSEQKLQNNIYIKGDRKYSYDIDKIISTVPSINTSDLKRLHTKVLSTKWVCSVGGSSNVQKKTEKLVSLLKGKQKVSKSVSLIGLGNNSPKTILTNIPSKQNIDFSIGAPVAISLHDKDYIPLTFAVAVLGKWGGFAGRLMSTVRELEGLTYGIYGKLEGFRKSEQGHWRIMTFFAPDKATQGLKSTYREISKLYKKGITDNELKKFKTILHTQQALLNDSLAGQLSDLHSYHCHGFSVEEMLAHKARISSLTKKEVDQAIKNYFDPKKLTISGAGPTKAVKKDIEKFFKTMQ